MNARDIFAKAHNGRPGRNFLTPDFISLGFAPSGEYVVELSSGMGINGQPMYGVTVVTVHPAEKSFEMSKVFFSLAEAREYVSSL
jgi:hypothetical protein